MSATYLNSWNQLPNHIEYRAHWSAQNKHLESGIAAVYKNENYSLWQKIYFVFKRIVEAIVCFFTPASFEKNIQSCFLPTSVTSISTLEAQFDQWRAETYDSRFTPYHLDLTTPDNQKLHAICYARDDVAKRDLPTIIYFPGMIEHASRSVKRLLSLAFEAEVLPYNVIVFDYRGSGLNRLFYGDRSFQARDLILDGETVAQAAIEKLGISETNVHFFGVSFGGAIGSFVAHMHTGRFINYNSFASLQETLRGSPSIKAAFEVIVNQNQENGCIWRCFSRISPSCSLRLLSWVVPYWGWDLEPRKVLPDLQGRILCVNHPSDAVIPDTLAAYQALPAVSKGDKCAYRCTSEIIESEQVRITTGEAFHKAPPKKLISKEDGLPMVQKLSQFLSIRPLELP
jgi:hypothetical protein